MSRILEEYANEPQNGKMLPGVSPLEAWQAHLRDQPLRRLADDARYCLATHKQVLKVREQGIVFTPRGQKEEMAFRNERTGQWIGRQVLVFYNIEQADLIIVSDLNRQNYFAVKRVEPIPAMSATSEQFAIAKEQVAAHQKAAKVIWGRIRHSIATTITRDNEVAATSLALGRFHNEAIAEHEAERESYDRKMKELRKCATALGVSVPASIRNPDRVKEAIEREAMARANLANSTETP